MKINWTLLEEDNEETIILIVNYSVFSLFGGEKRIERKAFKRKNKTNLWYWLDTNEIIYHNGESLDAIYSTKQNKFKV